jgi:hypothetical protein
MAGMVLAGLLREKRTTRRIRMEWTRGGAFNYPLIMAAGVSMLMFGLVGATALSGLLPSVNSEAASGARLGKTAMAAAARKGGCSNCGFIAEVRAMQVTEGAGEGGTILHRVVVRMDDGSERSLSQAAAPQFPVGARVRVVGNALEAG